MSQSHEHVVFHGTIRVEWDGDLTEMSTVYVSQAHDVEREAVQEMPLQRLVSMTNGAFLETLAPERSGRVE